MAVALHLFGLITGILLISQFWTLANDVYDPRQAKRIFGFIGAGASLGGFAGAAMTSSVVERIGTDAVLLVSAATLAACTLTVALVVRREPGRASDASRTGEEAGSAAPRRCAAALVPAPPDHRHGDRVRGHRRAIIEQQLNMARPSRAAPRTSMR